MLWPVISAVFLILTYPKFNLEFLAWIAFIPLFFALENKTLRQRIIIGYIFGLVFFAGAIYWLFNVTVPGTIVLILLLSLAPAIFCLLYHFVICHLSFVILAVPSAWVITEYFRTHFLTGFPWALLSHSQYLNLPIIQISDMTGALGVSFLIILVNFSIYKLLKKDSKRWIYVASCFFALAIVYFYGFYKLKEAGISLPLKVAVIQGNIPQEMKWDEDYEKFILDKYENITLKAAAERPDIVIWPETATPGFLKENRYIFNRVSSLAKAINTDILAGTIREKDSEFYNSATMISKEGGILESQDKIHLVPFGEYIPLEKYVPWLRGKIDKPMGDFKPGKNFTLFKIKKVYSSRLDEAIVKETKFYKFGTLICFEDIFPSLARKFAQKGASFLVNITNDAWFGDTNAPYQHVQPSVFRAVENRVPVVRAANTGVSCFINAKGRISSVVSLGGKEAFIDGYNVTNIYPAQKPAIYTKAGDIFVYLCIFIFLFSFIAIKLNS